MSTKTATTTEPTLVKSRRKPSAHFKNMLSDTFVTTGAVLDVIKTEVSYYNMDQKVENINEMLSIGTISEAEATLYKAQAVAEYNSRVNGQ